MEWAATQYNLGNADADRIRGGRADNLEHAIEHYQGALEVHTREDFPEQWADIQSNLGTGDVISNKTRRRRSEARLSSPQNMVDSRAALVSIGIAAALAGVLAAPIIKRFVLPAAEVGYKTACELWEKEVPQISE